MDGGEKLYGWYFEAHIRQAMDYTQFPFDHKKIELRLLPKQWQSNAVLVPDFDSYLKKDLLADSFGIDERIILDGYNLTETYFDYLRQSYDTNFGFPDYVGSEEYPELIFNIHLQRSVSNAFIIYLFPIIIVLLLLFGTMLTVTSDAQKRERMDFNISMIIASCSALFFILVLAHVELRDRFITSPIVYIECTNRLILKWSCLKTEASHGLTERKRISITISVENWSAGQNIGRSLSLSSGLRITETQQILPTGY